MSIEFKLPEVSEGVESADIAELHVAVGDVIEANQVVLEVETEKAVAEIECPHAGKITKIHVAEGDSVPVGGALLTIEESAPAEAPASQQPAEPTAAKSQSADAGADTPAEPAKSSASEKPPKTAVAESPPAKRQVESTGSDNGDPPPPAGPATRRLARELGVDLHLVAGSGSGGRITAEDVQAYVRTLTAGTGQPGVRAGVSAPGLPDFSEFGEVERQKLNKIAKSSAINLSTSWQVIPHVTQHDLVDITDLEAARKQFVQSRAGQDGPKVTMTAIMIKAVISVLKKFPHANASLDPQTDELVLKKYYHIGVAVDTPNGLLVPVVRDADSKSVVEIAGELADLASRARDRKLELKAMQGASFTITNLGGIGGTGFTPIVNYPEVAILGMSRSRKELQLRDGQLEERLMLPLSLSYDHRVINGADAARFVVALSQSLSNYFALLIDM